MTTGGTTRVINNPAKTNGVLLTAVLSAMLLAMSHQREITDPNAWQPLIESDDVGFFYAQEHYTPHIGFDAKPVILSRETLDETQLDNPMCDYGKEDQKAIENVDVLDDYRMAMIKFMDNKINIAGSMIMRLLRKYKLSLEVEVFYHYGYTSSDHDVALLAWKEKEVRHDLLLRPTSLVQALGGDEEVTSFAGTHKATDWVPYSHQSNASY